MMGLLSAEGYKLVRSKSFYICIAVLVGIVFLMYEMIDLAGRIQEGELENGTAGVVVSVQEGEGDSAFAEFGVLDAVSQIFSGDLLPCVLAVFVSVFTVGEFGSGMMKNVVGKGCARWKIFLAKLLATELATGLLVLSGIGAALLVGALFNGSEAFSAKLWKDLAVYGGLQILLAMALTAIYVFAGDLVRNYAAAISLGIGISAFPMVLAMVLDREFAEKGFALSDYWLVSRSADCPITGFSAGYIAETLLVAGVWFVLAAVAGIWHFSRADIR